MALFSECSLKCARIVLDTADIVREAIYRQLTSGFSNFRVATMGPLHDSLNGYTLAQVIGEIKPGCQVVWVVLLRHTVWVQSDYKPFGHHAGKLTRG
jgi:hypothetical protein